jgi:hypothetical protein
MKNFVLATLLLFVLLGAGCTNNTNTWDHSLAEESAQNVTVQYRDSRVNIADSSFEYLDTSKSSWINGAWYDSYEDYMVINLNSSYYHYCDMPSSTWNAFEKANSFGSTYNSLIKGQYSCEDTTVPNY